MTKFIKDLTKGMTSKEIEKLIEVYGEGPNLKGLKQALKKEQDFQAWRAITFPDERKAK